MLLTFSGISAITMLVLVANLYVHVGGAKSQMMSKSLMDRRKGEVYIRSTVSKHKPLQQNGNKVISYGSIPSQNIHSAWRTDKVPKVVSDYMLKTGELHSFVRSRRQNERSHNSKPEETVSEKVQVHKTVNMNKRRAMRNYRHSTFEDGGIFQHRKESALQNILLLHHFLKNHRNRAHTSRAKHRRISLVNTRTGGRKRFTHRIHNDFGPFHEPTRNKFMPNSIPSILSNPRDELLSYKSKVDPDEVYEQRINNENYYPEPLNSRNLRPNPYNEIENSEARLSSMANHLVARQRPKHQSRTYQSPLHDPYERTMEPVYRSFGSVDYNYEPERRIFDRENNNNPLEYQEEFPEDDLEQQSNVIIRGSDDEMVNGDYEAQDAPNSADGPPNEDNVPDPQILKTDTVGNDQEYEEYSYNPQDSNTKLLPNKFDAPDTYNEKDNMKNIFQDKQFRLARTDPLKEEQIIGEIQNTLLHNAPSKNVASEYEILNYTNTTGVVDGNSRKFSGNKAEEILVKILKDLQLTEGEESSKREEFACNVNGSWVSKVGGIRLELSNNGSTNLKVKVDSTMPARDNGILCKNWTFTGSLPCISRDLGLFTLSGYSIPQKKVAAFLGQCHSCGGEDTITGTWLIGKKARNCKDTHITINEVRDVWRKEMLHGLVEKGLQHRKHKGHHPCVPAKNTTTTPRPCAKH